MNKTNYKGKLSVLCTAGLMTFSLGASLPAAAGMVTFADPMPAGPSYPGCLPDLGGTPTGNDGGISYEWTVKMGKKDKVSFVNRVGAKSFNEPPPAYEPPDTGWTHTSNWVALELMHHSKLRIEVERQEGVPFTTPAGVSTARNKLVPAIAVYSGWDNTSCEDHRYNTSQNFDWSTVQFIGNQPNKQGRPVAVYSVELDAGRYSIAIGGSPKVLASYPDAATCNLADPICYSYTGFHGYRVRLKTDN